MSLSIAQSQRTGWLSQKGFDGFRTRKSICDYNHILNGKQSSRGIVIADYQLGGDTRSMDMTYLIWFVFLVVPTLWGILGTVIAERTGNSGLVGFLAGLVLGPVGVILCAVLVPGQRRMRAS
jgi:hypothetical protein